MASNAVYASSLLDLQCKAIRLVEILKGNSNSEKISCKFHYHDLQDSAPYTALSYTWGDPIDAKEILVDDRVLKIRDNLWRFLQQAREHYSSTLFWIDSICIDQENVSERNHQVSLMKNIYSKASQVAVWLGPAAGNSDLAIDRINKGAVKYRSKNFRPIWTAEEGRAIYELCHRKYWKRIWIVQEFILGKHITLYCGQRSFSWSSTCLTFEQLWEDAVCSRLEHHPFAAQVKSSYATSIVKQRSDLQNKADVGLTLNDLIERYKHMESTDVRDKVYDLLGLVQDSEMEELSIIADYSKSPIEVCGQLLEARYSHSGWELARLREFAKSLQETMRLDHIGHRLDAKLNEISYRIETETQSQILEERRREDLLLEERRRIMWDPGE